MKFTLSWLFDHLETSASLDEICDKLNMVGLEVEEVVDPAARLAGFEVAEILETEQHPDADKLKVCTVQSSSGTQKLVCGAPNARAGLRGILANEGAVIPANGMVLGKAKIRGVESRGMMCSAAELELSDYHDGIIELGDDLPVGTPAAEALGQTDPVIEIAITPNRPDCLGVRGIARDLAASGLGTLKEISVPEIKETFDSPVDIVTTSEACPVFAGRAVRGVKNAPSPDWLAGRLTAIGLKPINALVDITNYISYDRGRPLHVYDLSKLAGGVTVRNAENAESFTALDEETYELDAQDCVIADDAGVLALGGIMGGLASGSSLETVDVLIESAWFEPVAVANAGRRHNLESDARYRFERGVDPQSVLDGLDQATRMVLDLCGGEAGKAAVAGAMPDGEKTISFDPTRVQQLTGIELPQEQIVDILTRLGFAVSAQQDTLDVTSPSWRPDIEGQADLVEEVTRIFGLDNVPSVALPRPHAVARPILTNLQKRVTLARRVLAARGMVEAVTWSFIPENLALRFGGMDGQKLANPISSELSHMRPSLLPGLLMAAGRNLDRGLSDFALFEVGQEFTGSQPGEQRMAASGLRQGDLHPRHWSGKAVSVDVFDAKADAESVLAAFGVDMTHLQVKREAPDWYHPGRSGILCRDPRTPLAVFGELHPEIIKLFDLKGPVVGFEVYPENLPQPKKKATRAKPAAALHSLQALTRDFAFEVDSDVAATDLIRAARGADKKLITQVSLFDAFEGGTLGQGRKSLAIEVTLQPQDTTLTDADIEAVSDKIIAAVEKASGGKLRG